MLSMLLGFELQTRQPPVITLVGHRGSEGGGEWPIKWVGQRQSKLLWILFPVSVCDGIPEDIPGSLLPLTVSLLLHSLLSGPLNVCNPLVRQPLTN